MARGQVGTATRIQKERTVAQVAERLNGAASTVVLDYRGLKVAEDTELRRRLRAAHVEYRIVKNSLIGLAGQQAGVTGLDGMLQGPTAVAFSDGDPTAGPRELVAFAKDHQSLTLKGGVLGGRVLAAADVSALATLPSREVLLARVAAALASPLVATATVLGAPLRQLASLTDQLAKARGGAAAGAESA